MIKILKQPLDRKTIQLYYDKCNVEVDEVYSMILQFKKPYEEKSITINNSTSPTITTFLSSQYLIPFVQSSASLIGKSEFPDGVYEFDMLLLYMNNGNIAANKGQNEISLNNIIDDFFYSDMIYINGRVYNIDKTLSTQDKLVLTEPLLEDATTYKVVGLKEEGFFVLYGELVQKMLRRIDELTNCSMCNDKVRTLSEHTVYMVGLNNAIKCNDLQGAKTIYNYLAEIYSHDKCC